MSLGADCPACFDREAAAVRPLCFLRHGSLSLKIRRSTHHADAIEAPLARLLHSCGVTVRLIGRGAYDGMDENFGEPTLLLDRQWGCAVNKLSDLLLGCECLRLRAKFDNCTCIVTLPVDRRRIGACLTAPGVDHNDPHNL
jgi:hypothetical protein